MEIEAHTETAMNNNKALRIKFYIIAWLLMKYVHSKPGASHFLKVISAQALRKEFWNFGWDRYIYKQRSEKGLLVLLQELHCGIGEECMGQSFSGRGLDEIPLQTVKREEKKRPSMKQIHLNSLKIY